MNTLLFGREMRRLQWRTKLQPRSQGFSSYRLLTLSRLGGSKMTDPDKYILVRHLHSYFLFFLALSLFQCCFVREWFVPKYIFQKTNGNMEKGGVSVLGVWFLHCSLRRPALICLCYNSFSPQL